MAAPAILIDGSHAYGSFTVTINATPFKLNNVRIERPVAEATRNNIDGRPQDRRYTAQVATMTAEAQYPSSGSTVPIFGQTFTLTVDPAYGPETWIVMPQSFEATNGEGDIRVLNLVANKALNPSNITLVN